MLALIIISYGSECNRLQSWVNVNNSLIVFFVVILFMKMHGKIFFIMKGVLFF